MNNGPRISQSENDSQCEDVFQTIMDYGSDLVIIYSLSGAVLYANRAAIAAYGYAEDEFLRLGMRNLYPPEMRHMADQSLQATGGGPVPIRQINLRKNETAIHIEGGLHRTCYNTEEAIVSIVRDITAAVEAEAERAKQEEAFVKAFQISPGIGSISRLEDGRFKEVNDEFLSISGYDRSEVIGRTANDLNLWIDQDDRKVLAEQMKSLGTIKDLESHFRNKDGSVCCGLMSASVIHYQDDECMITNIRNITARKKMEEALRISNEKFHTIFSLSPDAVSISSLDGTYIDVNEGFEKLSGYTREEVIGRKVQDFGLWADDRDRDRMVAEMKRHGEVNNLEAWFICGGRVLRCGLLSARMISINGEACLLIANRDITERKQAEEILRLSEEKHRIFLEELTASQQALQTQLDELMATKEALQLSEEKFYKIFNLSPDAVTISRTDGIYVEVNEGFVKMSGFRKEEAIGLNSRDMNIWTDPKDRTGMVEGIKNRGEAINLEVRFRRKDGSLFDGLLSARTIDFGGENHIIAVVRDITERKRAEETLRHLTKEMYQAKVKQREAELNVLRSQINPHFLNNTLNLIKAEAVRHGNKDISSIVTSLGYLLRYTMNTHQDRVKIAEEIKFIRDYLGIYKRRFMDRFTYAITVPDALAHCQMPKLILQPIVENAFKHGLKNTESGGSIEVLVARHGDEVHFEVADNGEGMDPEVFEQLVKGVSYDEERHIGLFNIHQRLLLEYGEDAGIHISSEAGRYTRISFRIPWSDQKGEAGW